LRDYLANKGVSINNTAKGDRVPKVERAIRTLKERVCAVWNALSYKISENLVVHLVNFCCYTINLMPKKKSLGQRSPKESFTGIKVDYKRDAKIGFGDYVQVHEFDEIKNTMKERTLGAISLGPVGNVQGTCKFLNLVTWKVIHRSK
jgi:hypothetical protein